MTNDRNRIDLRIADAIRAGERKPTSTRFERLAARIENAALPELNERRRNPVASHWWEIAGGWANMLIPAGVTIILASVVLLWSVHPATPVAPPAAPARVVILGAVRTPSQTAIVDYAVDQIVGSPMQPAAPRGKR